MRSFQRQRIWKKCCNQENISLKESYVMMSEKMRVLLDVLCTGICIIECTFEKFTELVV